MLSKKELSWYLASLPVTSASKERGGDRPSLEICRHRAGANTSSCKLEGRKSVSGSCLMEGNACLRPQLPLWGLVFTPPLCPQPSLKAITQCFIL